MYLKHFMLCLMPVVALTDISEEPPAVCPVACENLVDSTKENIAEAIDLLKNDMEATMKTFSEEREKLRERIADMETSNSALLNNSKRQAKRIAKLEKALRTSSGVVTSSYGTSLSGGFEACEPNPCGDRRSCIKTGSQPGDYTCDCLPQFTGWNCNEDVLCPELKSPAHGSIFCTNANKYESVCTFGCSTHYELVGVTTLTCQGSGGGRNGHWNYHAPMCKGISEACDPNPCKNDGWCIITGSDPDDYTCNCLPQFTGRNCDEDVLCPELISPTHGSISCSNANKYNSVCTFGCSSYYDLVGVTTLTCQDSDVDGKGHWDYFIPMCTGSSKACDPNPCKNGGSCVVSNNESDDYTCDCSPHFFGRNCDQVLTYQFIGFFDGVVGNAKHVGEKNAAEKCFRMAKRKKYKVFSVFDGWCRTGPDEHALFNSYGPATAHGVIIYSVYTVGVLDISCSALTPPANGVLNCTNSNKYGSHCTVSCSPGYNLSGNKDLSCGDVGGDGYGDWDYTAPVCRGMGCPELTSPLEGEVSCTNSNKSGSQCIFSCLSGSTLSGESTLTCVGNDDGTSDWDHKPPGCVFYDTCESSSCENGRTCIALSDTPGDYMCICLPGFTGRNCDEGPSVGPCEPNPCENSGKCNSTGYKSGDYTCQCLAEFSGENCEEGPPGYIQATNNYWYRLAPRRFRYNDAKADCSKTGVARLASAGIRNDTVRRELLERLQIPGGVDVWIGLDYVEDSESWVWSDGVSSTLANTDWRSGQPSGGGKHCAHIDNIGSWQISDTRCLKRAYFLCEIPI